MKGAIIMEDLITVQKEATIKSVINRDDIYLLFCSVLLGVLFDILFYKKALGISYPLFVIAFYLVFLWNLRRKVVFKYSFGWFLSIPILALSATYFIFSNLIFATLNFLIIPILIIAQTILITQENNYKWYDSRFIKDIFYGIFNRAFSYTLKPFVIGLSSLRIRKSNEKYDVIKKILIGLTISIPLLIIVISLLASADRVFKLFIDEISGSFGSINIRDFSLQGIIALLIMIIAFSYIWSFSNPESTHAKVLPNSMLTSNRSWDPIISITILIAINCVYIVFTLIQFGYMFSPLSNALPPEFTYSEYARRGFFELLMVTLINFSLVLSSIRFTRKDRNLVARTVQILHSLLIICTVVILSSAYLRMSLYEAVYGYTYLRVLTHSFMIFLGVLFVIAFYKIWNERISLLKPYIVVSILAYMLLNFVNIDVIIVNNNIARYVETGKLDPYYLRNLSSDSIPSVVNLLKDGKVFKDENVFRDEYMSHDIKNYLAGQQNLLSKEQGWQSFNLSRQKAKQVLSQNTF